MGEDSPWSLNDAWDWMVECARAADASVRDTESWVPPVEEELVVAARASALSRWYPFTSHNYLRFMDRPPFWLPGGGDSADLPGCISFDCGGPDGSPVFRVWSGLLLRTPDPVLVLVSSDAAVAIEALVQLLTRDGPDGRGKAG
ncbi:hypothetical protein ACFWDI_20390 [Streptomyces sp. NPDC060064]|uniref:hypothetical protein n=1 Tax=Streptomyces sp. NPDC060064 TaxID=3347049 RepID=UPI0036A58D41